MVLAAGKLSTQNREYEASFGRLDTLSARRNVSIQLATTYQSFKTTSPGFEYLQ
jgi:hypothetical protein